MIYSLDEFFSKPTAVIDVMHTFCNDFFFGHKTFILMGEIFPTQLFPTSKGKWKTRKVKDVGIIVG